MGVPFCSWRLRWGCWEQHASNCCGRWRGGRTWAARPRPADYVMVLNGGEETRPFAAAALVKAGFARHVLVAATAVSPNVKDRIIPPYHEINHQVLLKRGIPERDITILPGAAATTFDEAAALAAFLAERPHARVLVVTSDYHSRRSRWIFARTLADRAEQVTFVSAPTDEFRMDCWWQDEGDSSRFCPSTSNSPSMSSATAISAVGWRHASCWCWWATGFGGNSPFHHRPPESDAYGCWMPFQRAG